MIGRGRAQIVQMNVSILSCRDEDTVLLRLNGQAIDRRRFEKDINEFIASIPLQSSSNRTPHIALLTGMSPSLVNLLMLLLDIMY